jgi:TonB family protein
MRAEPAVRRLLAALLLAHALAPPADPAGLREPIRVAVFDAEGDAAFADELARAMAADSRLALLDRGLVRAAARGAGYDGSRNMTPAEARRLGTAAGADALVLAFASVVERQASDGAVTGDAFLALYLVDGRTGDLLRYRGVTAVAPDTARARAAAVADARAEAAGWGERCAAAAARRAAPPAAGPAPEEILDLAANPDAPGVRPPRFFRRPSPPMTADAERARARATVDLEVTFNADGTYGPLEVARWAGLGLDQAAVETVRAARFWPASRGGRPVACRALLRFNFRVRDDGGDPGPIR